MQRWEQGILHQAEQWNLLGEWTFNDVPLPESEGRSSREVLDYLRRQGWELLLIADGATYHLRRRPKH